MSQEFLNTTEELRKKIFVGHFYQEPLTEMKGLIECPDFYVGMTWLSLFGKGLLSGAIIVAATEIAKKSTLFGALIISIPFTSILSIFWLYKDSGNIEEVANYADGILWLVLPSMILFIILPSLLRRDWSFEAAMSVSILATVFVYLIGAYLAVNHGNVTA